MILSRLAHEVVRRPVRILLVALTLSLVLSPIVILRLRLDTDVMDLFPQRSAEAQAFARFSRAFVADQVLLVLVEGDDASRLTEFADRYAAELRRSSLVADVRHKLSADSARFLRDHAMLLLDDAELSALNARLDDDSLARQARRLRSLLSAPGGSSLTPVLTADPLELLPLVGKRLGHGLSVDATSGYFRSSDGRALLLYVRPAQSAFSIDSDRALLAYASESARALGAQVGLPFGNGAGISVAFTGAVAYTLAYRDWLHRDTTLSTALSGISVLLLFALFFRAIRTIPLVAIPLFVGLLWTAGVAALIYGRINAVSLSFGTILLSIGIDLPIQLYNRLREELRSLEPLDALEKTVRDLGSPSIVATLGPAAVFLACALSDYRGLKELGVLAGIGLLLNLLAMLTVFPALLAVLPTRVWSIASAIESTDRPTRIERMGDAMAAHPKKVLALVAIAFVSAIFCARHLEFERRLIAIQPPAMEPAQVQAEVEHHFGEQKDLVVALVDQPTIELSLEGSDGWRREAEALRAQGLLQSYSSISSLFPSEKAQSIRRVKLDAMHLGDVSTRFGHALESAGFDLVPFAPALENLAQPPPPITLSNAGELDFLVRSHVQKSLVATYLYPAVGHRNEAQAALEHTQRDIGGTLTGGSFLERVLRAIVITDTIKVTIASVLLVGVLLALFYRRWRPWLAVMAPLGFAWALFAAVLAKLGIPLNLFNLLAVPLVIGYGIDDHVFLVHRYESDPTVTPGRMLATTGRAIILTSLSTMAGFAGLAVARFDGLRALGISGAIAVGVCLLSAFAVLPALLAILGRDTK